MKISVVVLACCLVQTSFVHTTGVAQDSASRVTQSRSWSIDGVRRLAILSTPYKRAAPCPVVFVYHGHGGTAKRMSEKGFERHWDTATFVYPQGLPTPTGRDPEGQRAGWQNRSGLQGDRDLKFFDTIIDSLTARGTIDRSRVYVTGHSNGGGMTALLWAARRDELAGVAISAGGIGEPTELQPLPVLFLAGRKDAIVPFKNQSRSIEWTKKVNQVDQTGEPLQGIGVRYPSELGCEVVTFIHDGGHRYLNDAPERTIQFFKELLRPDEGYPANDVANSTSSESRFDWLDSNRDNRLDPNEIPRETLFRRLDRDGDGYLSREEAAAFSRNQ